MTMAVARVEPAALDAALIKAVGLDRVPAEQRTLALHIAERYELDLMLKHLVMVDGRPYITRDGLLHVAHRSGVFDGIEVSKPVLGETHWEASATVYRKDMSRGFTYWGRYPKAGGNQKYAPEMATKTAECMALRRAFDVSAPVVEERWDLDEAVDATRTSEPQPLAARLAARRGAIEARPATDAAGAIPAPAGPVGTPPADHAPEPPRTTGADSGAPEPGPGPADAGEGGTSAPSPSPELKPGELRQWLRDSLIGISEARKVIESRYGDGATLDGITDAQRAEVRDHLAAHAGEQP